ncbi:MAG: hypothetical protein QF927_02400 [Verrucomicrobiota bacterium]|nr:hypothetical protein [Verrucomicrobiota bacterium]
MKIDSSRSIALAVLLMLVLGQAQAGPWLFTIDKGKSEIEFALKIDLGLTSETDSDSTNIEGTLIAELTPDSAPTEAIRITKLDARPTKKNIKLNYKFGPFGILGNAKFTVKDLRITLDPKDAGEETWVDDDGNFTQVGNVPTLAGVAAYDVNVVGVKQKDEIDLGNPEDVPEGNEPEPFDIEGNLTWEGDVPVLRFDFDIEQEIDNEEFEGIVATFTSEGTVFARGEQMARPPLLAIAPAGDGQIRLAWEAGAYVLDAATEPTFAESETIDITDDQAEYITESSGGQPQRFFRLRSR